MNNNHLQHLIGTHVVELEFTRRHHKLGWSDIRGLFGTTNPDLLNSEFGYQVLHFQPPSGAGMGYNYKAKGLCVAWDIFRQEFRVFGAEQIKWHRKWPLDTPEQQEEFKQYFIDYIINLSHPKRLAFMGYIGFEARKNQKIAKNRTGFFANMWNKFFGDKGQQKINKLARQSESRKQGLKSMINKFFKKS